MQVEMLKKGGDIVVECLMRLFNVCWDQCEVPQDWQDSCLVPIYKGKGDKKECSNYRGISLLSVVGKIYGRIIIKNVKSITDKQIGEEQCGFRDCRGCVDQVFTFENAGREILRKEGRCFYMFS